VGWPLHYLNTLYLFVLGDGWMEGAVLGAAGAVRYGVMLSRALGLSWYGVWAGAETAGFRGRFPRAARSRFGLWLPDLDVMDECKDTQPRRSGRRITFMLREAVLYTQSHPKE